MPSGILVIDKPAGWTSQDVTAKLRGVFHQRRIGHGGTLDPMATGVLPVFVGRATRGVQFFEAADKEYLAGLRLGLVTDTQDTTGNVLSSQSVSISREALLPVLNQFLGPQLQVPPMYSAIKIGGKKLYQLAREGKTAHREPRPIEIYQLELLEGAGQEFLLRVSCSKGTYIRTLCHDIGQALGCGGCMASLRRTRAGQFCIDQAISLDALLQFQQQGDPASLLMPVDTLFSHLPAYRLTPEETIRCYHGAQIPAGALPAGQYRVYGPDGEFLMVGQSDGALLSTVKSFFEVKSNCKQEV